MNQLLATHISKGHKLEIEDLQVERKRSTKGSITTTISLMVRLHCRFRSSLGHIAYEKNNYSRPAKTTAKTSAVSQ